MAFVAINYGTSDTFTAPPGVYSVNVTPYFQQNAGLGSQVSNTYNTTYSFGAQNITFPILATNDITARSSAVLISGGYNFNLASVSGYYSQTGITNKGDAYAWGNGSVGFYGVSTAIITKTSSPTAILGSLKFSQIRSNNGGYLGISLNGKLYGWGGVFGTGVQLSSPVLIAGGNFKVNKILYSDYYTSFIQGQDGYTYGFGSGNYLGINQFVPTVGFSVSSPTLLSGTPKFIKVGGLTNSLTNSTETTSFFGLTNEGNLYAWGDNSLGQLGTGDLTGRSSPVLILGNIATGSIFEDTGNSFYSVQSVSVIDKNGKLYAWGANGAGQLGTGDLISRSSPTVIASTIKFKKVISLNLGFSNLGLTIDNKIYSWGANSSGELATGGLNPSSSPVLISGSYFDVSTKTSYVSSFMVDTAGLLYGSGNNTNSELGVGDILNKSTPTLVLGGMSYKLSGQSYNGFGMQNTLNISVVPGQSYTITIGTNNSYFGNTAVSFGPIDKLVVSFEQ